MTIGQWTILDSVFVFIILLSVVLALRKGLTRELISLAALIAGFVMAALYYPVAAVWFADLARTEAVANLAGFLVIFFGCLLLGALIMFLVNRFLKMSSLEWLDRVLGGLYGLLRGWAVASILVLPLVAFPVRANAVARSQLAPYLLAGARAAVWAVPKDLREKFYGEYKKVVQELNSSRKTSV
jgi:membrane protein required for colicin V production